MRETRSLLWTHTPSEGRNSGSISPRVIIWINQEGRIVKICVLASGSSGNCTFISTGQTRVLVDAGLSARQIRERLSAIGEDLERIDAIFITHEHTDHIGGLQSIAKKFTVPIYVARLAAPRLCWDGCKPKVELFQAGSGFSVGDLDIQTFTIPHDAADPVGFALRAPGLKVAICTDLGYIPESVKFHLRDTDFLVLESNHDLEMLKVGPYPWAIKQRVMGRNGHLSNDAVSQFILDDLDAKVGTLVLGHLSEQNNHPAIARLSAEQALKRRAHSARLAIAERGKPTEIFTL